MPAYRVTGTIGGEQRKRQFQLLADAEATRDAWEAERLSAAAALRPKITRLSKAQLEEAEACYVMLEGSGFTLRDAVKALLRTPPPKPCELTFAEAYQQFLSEKKDAVSETHLSNYLSPCRRLSEYLGAGTLLRDVTAEKIETWLKTLSIEKKSWNNYRNDLAVVHNWFAAKPRQWITDNPVHGVKRYRKRDTLPANPPEALTPETVKSMMAAIEREQPHWTTFFALAVFAGIRPDREDGEMWKLSNAIAAHGVRKYFRGGNLHITAQIAKDGRARKVPLPPNLQKWLARYPVTPAALRGGSRSEYTAIRAKWKIPHDGLRHTSMSACAAVHGIAAAVARHGNSERICLDHYLDLYERADADAFYSIAPTVDGDTNAAQASPITHAA